MRKTRLLVLLAFPLIGGALSGCTPPWSASEAEPPAAPVTVPNWVPDDVVAATDPARPVATDVVLSTASWDTETSTVQAGGYVSPAVEDGGTCTLELRQDEQTVAVDGPATADASTTVCAGLTIGGSDLGPGTWEAVLRYESRAHSGTSSPVSVEVPR